MQKLAEKEENENKIQCLNKEASEVGPKATKLLLKYILGRA